MGSDFACVIDEGDTFLMTGGKYSLNTVSRYTVDGWLENLGDLNIGRTSHACGQYTDTLGRQINIVAGGKDEFKNMMLASIEVNVNGEYSWSFGTPLSKPLYESRGVTVMSQFYLTGGKDEDGNRLNDIQLYSENGWINVGDMSVPRSSHALSVVNFDDIC